MNLFFIPVSAFVQILNLITISARVFPVVNAQIGLYLGILNCLAQINANVNVGK